MTANSEKYVKVTGSGHYLPGDPVPPDKLEYYLGKITRAPKKVMRWLEKTGPLMREMLDIEYYHYAINPDTREMTETHQSMGVKAAKAALEAANMDPQDVEFIGVGSPFAMRLPPLSTLIQDELGIDRCAEITVFSNCSSPYKALMIAHDAIRLGRYKNALIISTSMTSSAMMAEYYNQEDLTQEDAVLRWFLSDGAGAVVLESSDIDRDGVFLEATYIESLNLPSAMGTRNPGYWVNPLTQYKERQHHIYQKMDRLAKHVADPNAERSIFSAGIERMVKRHSIDLSDLKFFQINMPSKQVVEAILDDTEKTLGIKRETVYTKIATMGYPGPPACLICLDKILREETLMENDMILSFVLEVSKFMQAGFVMRKK
ncbi:3-oxoacyl-ACP synthase [Acidobacteriota bacterium]